MPKIRPALLVEPLILKRDAQVSAALPRAPRGRGGRGLQGGRGVARELERARGCPPDRAAAVASIKRGARAPEGPGP